MRLRRPRREFRRWTSAGRDDCRMEKVSFYDQISRNKRNSWLLMIVVFASVAALSLVMSVIFSRVYGPGFMFVFLMFATVFNIGYIVYTYYNSAKIALSSVKARKADGPQYQQLRNIVDEMTIAGGMPRPEVYVMPSPDINAFATGRDPEHSVVCVTDGAVQKLSREELQGVIAHELTHIRNYDIRFVTLVAVMVGLVSIISQMFLRSMWYSSMGGGGRNRGGGNTLLLVIGIALSIIAPIIVMLVQMAISRRREYMADAGAVELTRYPQGLIGALEKIGTEAKKGLKTEVNKAVAPMFLSDPTRMRLTDLFNTHPPIENRIKALKAM
ncbi:MAG: M48 family metallopeptidase [Candidatus Altiarchaeota archaeon]